MSAHKVMDPTNVFAEDKHLPGIGLLFHTEK